ncbi:MAG TPA: DUF4097 family beta strand repeat-containing protein [Candidatus Eisenbacteria bacterium]|nr:DUF4097 family beta strand repeat-containing protein [Candidatus Eisenbacteria bacterium]
MRSRPNPHAATLALAALLAAAAVPAWAVETVSERSERAADVAGIARLVVENSRGRVELRPSPDDRLHVAALKTCRGGRVEDARRLADGTSVRAGAEGPDYVVHVDYPRRMDVRLGFWDLFGGDGWGDRRHPLDEVALTLAVPAGLPVQVRTVSGDVDSQGIAAAQDLHTTSGDLRLYDAGGPAGVATVSGDLEAGRVGRARVHTTSGDVVVNGARGALEVRTVSGDVTLDAAADSVQVHTVSGDVTVGAAPRGLVAGSTSGRVTALAVSGGVRAASTSGTVRVELRPPLGGVTLESTSGDVRLELPAAADASLDLSSLSGSLASDVPLRIRERGRHRLVGDAGRGGPPVRLRTASGDITVTRGGN